MSEDREWAARLRAERVRRGWNRPYLARQMHRAAVRLRIRGISGVESLVRQSRRWERGEMCPDSTYQVVLAGTFGLTVRELFGEATAVDIPSALLAATGGTVEVPHFARAEDDPMQRRALLAWLAALAAGTATLPDSVRRVVAEAGGHDDLLPRITMRDVANLDTANQMFTDFEHSVGGGLSRAAVVAQLSWAVDQLDARVPGTREALDAWRVTTARLADTAGWMSHDAGREQQARALLVLGYQIASTVERDPRGEPQRAHLLSQLARQAVDMGRPRTGLDLLRQAQSASDEIPPVTRSKLHAIKARAFGLLGDELAVRRELDLSQEEFGRRTPDQVALEPWLRSWHTEAQVRYNRGSARYLLMTSSRDATTEETVAEVATEFRASAGAWGPGEERTQASARLRAAGVLMVGREPAEAVRVAREVLPVLPGLRSQRVLADVRDLASAAEPFRGRSDVDDLVRDLTAVTG